LKILVLGGISYNLMVDVTEFPTQQPQTIHAERFHETLGSTGAGKSMALKRLGMEVRFHGVIGEDRYGDLIRERMNAEQIPFFYDVDPQGTERHVNLMKRETGERLSLFLQSPSEQIALNEERIEALMAEADVVFLNIAPYCRRFLPLLQKHRKSVWCDLHSYDGKSAYFDDFIDHAHVLQFSSDANPYYEETMKTLQQKGKELVICTHGAEGATAVDADGQWHSVAGLPYEVVDTNGAGDNFFAGVLVGRTLGHSVEVALRVGAVVAGLCVTSPELIDQGLSLEKMKQEYARHYGGDAWPADRLGDTTR
jgi:acarbose 7IV-phosphotransferase